MNRALKIPAPINAEPAVKRSRGAINQSTPVDGQEMTSNKVAHKHYSSTSEKEQEVDGKLTTFTKPPSARDDKDFHAAKRRKATTTQLSPPYGNAPITDVKTLSPTDAMNREEERKPISFQVAPVENWIETSDEGNYVRDDEGKINYGFIKMYGETIDLGLGASGLKENKRSKTAHKKLRDGNFDGLHFEFSDQKRKVTELESVLPYELKPAARSQSRKDSSSLLNKPLAQNASKTFATSSSATPATSLQAETTAPPPAQGWGNLFKKEEGSWACLTCRSSNPKTASSCLACDTPKGEEAVGENPSEEDAGNDKKDDDSKGPTFCFDNKDSGNTFTFSSGAPVSDSADSNASGGFTFGAAKTEDSKGDTLKPSTGGFTFEATKTEDSKGDTLKPATSGFTFVATSTAATEKKNDTPKPTF